LPARALFDRGDGLLDRATSAGNNRDLCASARESASHREAEAAAAARHQRNAPVHSEIGGRHLFPHEYVFNDVGDPTVPTTAKKPIGNLVYSPLRNVVDLIVLSNYRLPRQIRNCRGSNSHCRCCLVALLGRPKNLGEAEFGLLISTQIHPRRRWAAPIGCDASGGTEPTASYSDVAGEAGLPSSQNSKTYFRWSNFCLSARLRKCSSGQQ
jgi:hypothetical protein